MALRLSTGLVDNLMEHHPVIDTLESIDNITFVNATSKIHRAAGSFIDDGFEIGDFVYSDHGDNPGPMLVTVVEATDLTLEDAPTNDAAAATYILCTARGGSFKDLFRNGVMRIYSGTRPASADAVEAGTMLVEISESSGAFAAGEADNGLNFGDATTGKASIADGETWSGTAEATGTATWFRFYANAYTTGASTSAVRFDGSCGASGSGADLIMSSTSITAAATETINQFDIECPDGV